MIKRLLSASLSTRQVSNFRLPEMTVRHFQSRSTTKLREQKSFAYLIIAVPFTALALGTWQVQRRTEKLQMIDEAQKKLEMEPIHDISELCTTSPSTNDSRPVEFRGFYNHSLEMLVGPRQRNGQTGYHVITPFTVDERNTILVNRGWIRKTLRSQDTRSVGLEKSFTKVYGLLRRSTAKNIFTPVNDYEKEEYYFVDIEAMSKRCGASPILVEQTIDPSIATEKMEAEGYPVGRPHEVLLKNNHLQYIITCRSYGANERASVSKAPCDEVTNLIILLDLCVERADQRIQERHLCCSLSS